MHNNIDACARDDARARIDTKDAYIHAHASRGGVSSSPSFFSSSGSYSKRSNDSKDSRLYINASRSLSMSHASSGGSVRRHRLFSSMRRRSSSSQISSSSFRVHARGRVGAALGRPWETRDRPWETRDVSSSSSSSSSSRASRLVASSCVVGSSRAPNVVVCGGVRVES